MQILLFSLLVGFTCGIIGIVYRQILAYESILNWWFKFGDRFCSYWFYRPVWECSKCFAGQLAAWFWLLFEILPAIIRHYRHAGHFFQFPIHCTQTGGSLILGMLEAISAAILTAVLISNYLDNNL